MARSLWPVKNGLFPIFSTDLAPKQPLLITIFTIFLLSIQVGPCTDRKLLKKTEPSHLTELSAIRSWRNIPS